MDGQAEYGAARELALTGRYREARVSLKALLQGNPSHVEALILLGKVEFYLRHPAASRRCFETALSYEPENIAAFFGIEYHRQRTQRLFLIACVVVLLAAIAGAAALLAHRMSTATHQLDARLDATFTALSGSLDRVGSAVEELRISSKGEQAGTQKTLSKMRAELEKLSRRNVDLLRKIEELRKASFTGNEPSPTVP